MRSLLWVLLVALLVLGTVFAQDDAGGAPAPEADAPDTTGDDDDEKKSTDGPGVTTTTYFPGYPHDQTFPVGEYIDTLVGLANNADTPTTYRIEYVLAYLTSRDGGYFFQNFTGAAYNRSVANSESATVRYRFKPDAQLDTRDYQLLVQVFYLNDDNETFLSTPFNSTVVLTEPDTSLDGRTAFGYLSFAGIIGIAGYAFYTKKMGGSSRKSDKPKRERSDGVDWDWAYVPKEHREFARARSHTPKKTN